MTAEMFNDDQNYLRLPLIRIRVDYSGGYEALSLSKFAKEFDGQLANPKTFLYFYKLKTKQDKYDRHLKKDEGFGGSKCKVTGGEALLD